MTSPLTSFSMEADETSMGRTLDLVAGEAFRRRVAPLRVSAVYFTADAALRNLSKLRMLPRNASI